MLLCDVDQYWKAITVLEAQDMLINLQVQSYAWMKKPNQDKLHKETYKKAYPTHLREDKILSSEEVARLLGKMING